jgi:tetratricopeptide (TPR) repeat protein
MVGRISCWLLAFPLTCLCGCITTQTTAVAPAGSSPETAKSTKREEAPKRTPQSTTMVELGKLKEAEADTEDANSNPEAQAQRRDEARQAYQFAIKIDPNNLEAQARLGRLYSKIGDFERAQDTLKKALAAHPKDASLWYDLGMCHNRRKDFNESVRCFSKAVELQPENREYLKKLGFTLAWTGHVEQGLTYLTRAHGAALAHFNIACMLDQKQQPELAKQHCRLARAANGEMLDQACELLALLERPAEPGARLGTLQPVGYRE